ncbi:MAG: hypothetical protein IPK82_27845 [Polyangiaceae bacterium]|nr:hypothetical protein [Polyangiaceae bacterium]
MNRIEIDANADATGSIRIRLPAQAALRPVHLVIEWSDPQDASGEALEDWIKATAGAITDPTFSVEPPGDYEQRDEIP